MLRYLEVKTNILWAERIQKGRGSLTAICAIRGACVPATRTSRTSAKCHVHTVVIILKMNYLRKKERVTHKNLY